MVVGFFVQDEQRVTSNNMSNPKKQRQSRRSSGVRIAKKAARRREQNVPEGPTLEDRAELAGRTLAKTRKVNGKINAWAKAERRKAQEYKSFSSIPTLNLIGE